MPGLENETPIALSELILKTEAPVVFVSAPQCGPARSPQGGPMAPYSAVNVMNILECLPEHVISQLKISFAVDFAGSRNSQFADTRIHSFNAATGTLFRGQDDFKTDLRPDLSEAPKSEARKQQLEKLPSCDEAYRRCVENSYWMSMWRGQITGALSSSLVHAPVKEVNGLDDILKYNCPTSDFGMRYVVAVSIDGGPITQVEKAWLPDVFATTLSNLRRRGYEWGACAKILWCNFPTLEDCLRSLGGVQNLAMDLDTVKSFDWGYRYDEEGEFLDASPTFTCISSLDKQCDDVNMLYSEVSEILSSKTDVGKKLKTVMSSWDEDAALFILDGFQVDPNLIVDDVCLLNHAVQNGLPRVVWKLKEMGRA
eukprot:TRINITY_DN12656_c0_g4_i2.p1 TRINITY_DN12656_c0_g4~~TRINITY_DN12656_c0_g4_i2.p1  ORF type:complete len:369 (-),score=49.03 TRINITY_DN12656_c0_g4_i2:281-1387(-)